MSRLREFSNRMARLIRGTSPSDQRHRSRTGLVATLLFVPVLLGVMGCFELPAPIGDPERSRIEPGISGMWLDDGGELDGLLMIFEPFDRRTWLVRWINTEDVEAAAYEETGEIVEMEDGEELILDPVDSRTRMEKLRSGALQIDDVALFKVWRKRISGKSFFTMEFRGHFSAENGMQPDVWWGARMRLVEDDRLELHFIDKDFEEFTDDMTRRQLERVIRRHHENLDLYASEQPLLLTRIQQTDYDSVAEMLDELGLAATYD